MLGWKDFRVNDFRVWRCGTLSDALSYSQLLVANLFQIFSCAQVSFVKGALPQRFDCYFFGGRNTRPYLFWITDAMHTLVSIAPPRTEAYDPHGTKTLSPGDAAASASPAASRPAAQAISSSVPVLLPVRSVSLELTLPSACCGQCGARVQDHRAIT